MDRHEEIELLTTVGIMKNDVQSIKDTITILPCKQGIGFKCWSIQTKAVAGTGVAGVVSALILAIYDMISKGGH